MIVHKWPDIPHEHRRDDAQHAERDTHQIHVPVALRVRHLPGSHHDLVRHLVPRDARNLAEVGKESRICDADGGPDERGVGDAQFEGHGAADVIDGVFGELLRKDAVVDREADDATEDTDGEGEGRDCGDEVLWVWVLASVTFLSLARSRAIVRQGI